MEDNEKSQVKRKAHPQADASLLSRLFFCWELPIFLRGFKEQLNEDDLYEPLGDHNSEDLGDALEQIWRNDEERNENPSLWTALIKMFGLKFVFYGVVFGPLELSFFLLQPYLLKQLLEYFSGSNTEIKKHEAYWYATVMVLVTFLRVIGYHWKRMKVVTLGMKLRVAFSSLIYRKTLKLKRSALQKVTMGQIVNLLSSDVNRCDSIFLYTHYLWIGFVKILATIYFIDVILGHTALVGFVVVLAVLLLHLYCSRKMMFYRRKTAIETDHRIRLMNDIICGIKLIKMYAWEKPYAQLVKRIRMLETDQIEKANFLRLIPETSKIFTAKISVLLCILVAALTGLSVTSQFAFVLIVVYDNLSLSIVGIMRAIQFISEAGVTVRRIEDFLMIDREKDRKIEKQNERFNKISGSGVLKTNYEHRNRIVGIYGNSFSVKWNSSSDNVLNDVTFCAVCGELTGVVGAAGSGKSTLLQAILKENIISKGSLDVEGSMSYTSQEPWIFSASIRQNILFGERMNRDKYFRVIQVCSLEEDLSVFPHGDQTQIGERGLTLSGGQKARISLARAVYKDTDIYLLDDPLSAVDAHVGKKIFEECILGYLKSKCVVLVTHQVEYLKDNCKKIYVIQNCNMTISTNITNLRSQIEHTEIESANANMLKRDDSALQVKEHRTDGNASRKVYKSYCLAGQNFFFLVMTFLFIVLTQGSLSSSEFFLNIWMNMEQEPTGFYKNGTQLLSTSDCLCIYGGFVVASAILIIAVTWSFTNFTKDVSRNLHDMMLSRLLEVGLTFFQYHNSGRILNRFSKDLGYVDEYIPIILLETIMTLLPIIGACVIISILNYWMIIPSIVTIAVFCCYSITSYPTNKSMKRIEAITRSPIFMHLTASVQGLTTIRAFNNEKLLAKEFDGCLDLHSTAFYLSSVLHATLGFWTDVTSIVYLAVVTGSYFLLKSNPHIGNVGVSITQAMSILIFAQHGVKIWSELDIQMTSVERVIEYTQFTLEKDDGKKIPPETWPSTGSLSLRSASMRYSLEAPLALDRVTFQINANEKIGIVGRTGAGKSSLISALLRLFEFEGEIIIDDIDTKSIPLTCLRRKIAVIPQEPILFVGTLRRNLDPFNEFTDLQLWNVLEEVQLKNVIAELSSGLDCVVLEGGSNFSVGQKQLICLGRAILRNVRIIVLDEATANVDLQTDELIQSMIRKKFQNCTVLTIAHRLDTIMDSDKVLVMENGRVEEFDQPNRLLENPNGLFYSYVMKKKANSNHIS